MVVLKDGRVAVAQLLLLCKRFNRRLCGAPQSLLFLFERKDIMLNKEEVFFIEDEQNTIILDIIGMCLYNVSKIGGMIVRDVLLGKETKETAKKFNIEEEKINKYILNMMETIKKNLKNIISSTPSKDVISRLNINVAHACNFACKYCYAGHGLYDSPIEEVMSSEIAQITAEFFLRNFEKIKGVVFFGGEPLLNIKAIEKICETFDKYVKENPPEFAVLTNGSIFNNDIANVLSKYHIAVNISIDGPQEIHDNLRTYKNGKGTFQEIVKNIERFKELNITIWYEASYTPLHKKMNINKHQLKNFIENELGIKNGTITDVFLPLKSINNMKNYCFTMDEILGDFDSFYKLIDISLSDILEGKSFNNNIGRLASYFIKKIPSYYICPAALQTFTVTPKGDIYPCQFFIEDKFKLGNVYNGINEGKRENFINKLDKRLKKECKDCWVKFFCETCPGQYYQMTGKLELPGLYCKSNKELWEVFIRKISKILCNPEKKERFVKNFNELSKGGIEV
uniref:Radical SAM protein n=1 Tax=candidate division WOR-3 bacterium TaxID=2052148 RepID=A0A7C4YDI8_UNCW3